MLDADKFTGVLPRGLINYFFVTESVVVNVLVPGLVLRLVSEAPCTGGGGRACAVRTVALPKTCSCLGAALGFSEFTRPTESDWDLFETKSYSYSLVT